MTKHIALAVLLSASALVAPLQAQDAVFRSQMNAPILFGSGSGDGAGGNDGPVEMTLDEHIFPEYSVGDAFEYDFNTLLGVTGGNAADVDWDLGTPNNLPVGFSSAGVAEGDLDAEGEYDFEIVATHPDADAPAQQVYTIVVNGVELQVTQISAGGYHTCAVTTAGAAYCWGAGSYGQLGNNGTSNHSSPVPVIGLSSGVSTISARNLHTCAVTTAGAAYCWGAGSYGQLGNNGTSDQISPVPVDGLSSGVSTISAGDAHTCAITTEGAAYCWGNGANYRLGNNGTSDQISPVSVSGLSSGVVAISAGNAHTCAVTTAGAAYCWGQNNAGQIGNGGFLVQNTPVPVRSVSGAGNLENVSAISAGYSHTCAVTMGGAAYCWGNGANYRLGNNGMTQSRPVPVSGLSSGVAAISTVNAHTCAVTTQGTAWCWGDGSYGQIGNGGTANGNLPIQVGSVEDAKILDNVRTISAGASHTCAVTTQGAAWCWGDNSYGQLGDGGAAQQNTPADVIWN